jgi:ABC-type transport system involved in multi-copper enzyme maturation permease subunit
MSQTLAILHDAYRELNAKAMFWVVLGLSVLVIAGFALFGANAQGMTFLAMQLHTPFDGVLFYRYFIFSVFVVGWWLSFGAMILALISTASIFPDFIATGSIDLYMSRPISRLRLFLTKYLASLLFVALQVTLFVTASFIVLGWRGHYWRPQIFLAIPLFICFFSYLYAFCVLIGVLTRSTVAAILLTVLFWVVIFGIGKTEEFLLGQRFQMQQQVRRASEDQRAQEQASADSWARAHKFALAVKTVLPKTTETNNLLDRWLVSSDEMVQFVRSMGGQNEEAGGDPNASTAPANRRRHQPPEEDMKELIELQRSRSPAWIIGTSLAFEVVIVALAAWIFCRRDY